MMKRFLYYWLLSYYKQYKANVEVDCYGITSTNSSSIDAVTAITATVADDFNAETEC
jgi:hypothetical protein